MLITEKPVMCRDPLPLISLACPKSQILRCISGVRSKLSGLRSRWTIAYVRMFFSFLKKNKACALKELLKHSSSDNELKQFSINKTDPIWRMRYI